MELSVSRRRKPTNVAFREIGRLRSQLFEQTMRADGMTLSKAWLPSNVASRDGLTRKELATRVMGTVTLGGLQARGLVERRPHPGERRGDLVCAQPQAGKIVDKILRVIRRMDEVACRGMSPEEIAMVDDPAPRIRDNPHEALFPREDLAPVDRARGGTLRGPAPHPCLDAGVHHQRRAFGRRAVLGA